MPRQIRLTFVKDSASAVATLLEESAPRTCEAVWDALPTAGFAHHGIYSGSEGVLILPDTLQVDPESSTADVARGDVAFVSLEAGSFYGVEEGLSEVAWFYDQDAVPSMMGGAVPVTIFARIDEPADEFYSVSRRMRREGVHMLLVSRVEPGVDALEAKPAFRPAVGGVSPPLVARVGDDVVVVISLTPDAELPHPQSLPTVLTSPDGGWSWIVREWVDAGVGVVAEQLVVEGGVLGARTSAYGFADNEGGDGWRVTARSTKVLEVPCGHGEVALGSRGPDDAAGRISGTAAGRKFTAWDVPGVPADSLSIVEVGDERLIVFRAWDGPPGNEVPASVQGVWCARLPAQTTGGE